MSDNRQWMYARYNDRPAFERGLERFLQYAINQIPFTDGAGKIKCPCKKCKHTAYLSVEKVREHVTRGGFVHNYKTWVYHGEVEPSETNRMDVDDQSSNNYQRMVWEHAGPSYFEHSQNIEEPPNPIAQQIYDMLKSAEHSQLVELCRRRELNKGVGDKQYPKACYTLDKDEKRILLQWITGLKFPDGYVSNMNRCVDLVNLKMNSMKSHDCHVFMQMLLPVAFKELLPSRVWEAITELSVFFKELCSRSISIHDMGTLNEKIPVTLCKLERIFPPSFFDSMEHLPVHLADEARLAGPVQYRWMYPFERYLRTLKNNIKNKAKVEGSISK